MKSLWFFSYMDVALVHKQGALVLTLASSDRADAAANIKRLLANGVPANISDGAGFSALSLAARSGNAETVAVLLESGASANLPTRDHGNSPLFWASKTGHGTRSALSLFPVSLIT